MLRRMEPVYKYTWLEVVGWGIEWGAHPSALCTVFTPSNISDDFHWSLYQRFTADTTNQAFKVCALAEVEWKDGVYRATGRVRRHDNIPKEAEPFIHQELLRYNRERRPLSRVEAGERALELLGRIALTDWAKKAAFDGAPEINDMVELLKAVRPSKSKKRRAA